ncbi:LytR/AlgR family response regulator transcription factor [Aquimarina sp. 2-A2]|uniref:LytR/AlgR family response regulator transcription factor n=1 Tax=Aquimarina sp. 2-A2 TaxID=3382644 RepID=UPI00387F0E74
MKIRCLIVDDEPLAVRLIEKHCASIDVIEVIATCNSAIKAFEILNTEAIDLMFLDIKMPQLTGIDFLKSLKNPPKTIFTTAYRDFAVESYDLETIDYLLKPITFERFIQAIDKYTRLNQEIRTEKQSQATYDEFIIVRSGSKYHKIVLDQIIYIESLKDYIQIHLENDKVVVSKYKLGAIEQELAAQNFLRVHRSYIINTSKISAFSKHTIELNSQEIPIGASYNTEVVIFLEQMKGLA